MVEISDEGDQVPTPGTSEFDAPKRSAARWGGRKRRLGLQFLAVFGGMLMALSTDSCYDGLQGLRLQAEYHQRVFDDLKSEREFLQELARHASAVEALNDSLESLLEHDQVEADPASLIKWLHFASNRRISPEVSSTYADLVNTGSLGLFADPGYRNTLHTMYSWLERIHSNTRFGLEFRDEVRRSIPVSVQVGITDECGFTWDWPDCHFDIDAVTAELALQDVRANPSLRGAFRIHAREMWTLQRDVQDMLDYLDRIEDAYFR